MKKPRLVSAKDLLAPGRPRPGRGNPILRRAHPPRGAGREPGLGARSGTSPSPRAATRSSSSAAEATGSRPAFYLASQHGLKNIAVVEKGWLGGGNVGRNTTIIRSNYMIPGNTLFYELSLQLWETLSRELNFNLMVLAARAAHPRP